MSRKTLVPGLSLLAALMAAGLFAAPAASAESVTLRVSAFDGRTFSFDVATRERLVVRSARLRTAGTTTRPRLRAVRRGLRRGTIRLKAPRLRAARTRTADSTRLTLRARKPKPAPTEPTPTEPAPTEPAPTQPAPTEPAPTEPAPTQPAPSEPTQTQPTTTGSMPVAGREPIPAGAYYVSPSGSDTNPGTVDRPWRSLQKAVAAARPGDTVVLRSGTYGARGTVNLMNKAGTATAPITYRGYPGETMPRILGFFKITASYQRFSYMLFDGPTGTVKAATTTNPRGEEVQVSIIGSAVEGIEISHSEIRNSNWHAGLFLSGARNAKVVANYIHDNGDENDPGQVNQSHGIYWSSGSGLIANNVIEHNLARGIQLYKSPTNVTIANNTIVKNGKAGIQFAWNTSNSIAVNNLIAHNEYGVRTDSLTGTGNVVRNNMLWGNPRGDVALSTGLTLSANRVSDARFVGASNYRLQSASPAIDTAVASFAPVDDMLALPRPVGGGPDLGAYEAR